MPLNNVTPLYPERELTKLHPETPGNLRNIMLGVKAQIWGSHPWDLVEDPYDLNKRASSVQDYFLMKRNGGWSSL